MLVFESLTVVDEIEISLFLCDLDDSVSESVPSLKLSSSTLADLILILTSAVWDVDVDVVFDVALLFVLVVDCESEIDGSEAEPEASLEEMLSSSISFEVERLL